MKNRKWNLIVIGLMILTSLNIFGETKKLRNIGRYRFIPVIAGASPSEMMKTILEKYADDIQQGFELAGQPDLYNPFIDQIRQGAYKEGQLAVGDKMLWMIFRSQGQIKVVYDLEWAGQGPLPVYSFSILEGNKRYELIMPESCGNISLVRVDSLGAPAAQQKPLPTAPFQEKPEDRYQISKAKIYQDIADLINEVDLYCSFSIWEEEIPDLKMIGAEREYEKEMSSDGDVIYLNKGKDDGVEPGQIFLALEIKDHLPGYGPIALKKGRARVNFVSDRTSVAVVEHSCDGVRLGHYLVPFEAGQGMAGKDLGYNIDPVEAAGGKGRLVYLQGSLKEIGSGQWALVDLGGDKGIQVGQQLILYRRIRADLPVMILGNCLVIDVQRRTSTVKVLSCRDVIQKGDLVMERPSQ